MTSLLFLLACSGGKSPDYPPPPCSYDWTDAPCSEEFLDRVRCDPCGKAWKCGPVDWEERYPIWVRQDHDCTCESKDGMWYEEPGCGGETEEQGVGSDLPGPGADPSSPSRTRPPLKRRALALAGQE